MRRYRPLISLLLALVLVFTTAQVLVIADSDCGIKNIIYMIPDGGGMASFQLADAVKQAGGISKKFPSVTPVDTGEMYIKQYLVGAETTHSASDDVTDSAAGGTALSSGYKTNNKMLGVDPYFMPHANILEACQEIGKNTGLVVTYEWTNATPAAFSAHAEERTETYTLGEQIINQGIDVVLGSTLDDYYGQEWFSDKNFESLGYDIIKTKSDLANVKPGDRMWSKLPELYFDTNKSAEAPTLAEMTKAAITALDDGNENGFFLMVEGSTIDLAGHNSDPINVAGEFMAFDAACKVAIEYAKGRNDTMVVIMPDHDTGGIVYKESDLSGIVSNTVSGIYTTKITWEGNGSHTGRNGGIFMYLPDCVEYPEGINPVKAADVAAAFTTDPRKCNINLIDNTEMAPYLAAIIGVDLDALTDNLFVDVTKMGKITSTVEGETFVFGNKTPKKVEIRANTSTATIDGTEVDLGGRVAISLNGKFFVPQLLLDMINGTETDETPDFIVEKKYIKETPAETEKEDEIPVLDDPAVKGHWAESYLAKAVADGLIKGSDKGIEPDRNVTKAELITMLTRALNIENKGGGAQWYSYVADKAVELGWTNNLSDIEADINRAASAGIIANAMKISAPSENAKTFTDEADIIATGYFDSVMACVANGLISGYPDGSFSPVNTITRSEAVVIIQRAFYNN